MKKTMVFLVALLLFRTGTTLAQDKLLRYDEKAFETLAKKLNDDKSNPYVSSWAKDVFRSYCELKDVQVGFTEKDFQDTLRVKADVEKNYKKLLKDKTEADTAIAMLKREKITFEANLKRQQEVVDSLKLVIKDKNKEIKEFPNKVKQDSLVLSGRINDLEKDLTATQKTVEKHLGELKAKEQIIASYKEENDSLSKQVSALGNTIKKYQEAFETVKNTINRIYDGNKMKHLVDMDVSELAKAESAWNGIKALLESTDDDLAKELKKKVDEINQWKSAVEPIQGAVKYMKGKYDNDQRSTWIAKLKNLTLDKEKSTERDKILTALNDQEKIKENYDIILDQLEKQQSLPDGEALILAKKDFEKTKGFVKKYYHESYYDSYDDAVRMIIAELGRKEASSNVDLPESFEKFIDKLRNKF